VSFSLGVATLEVRTFPGLRRGIGFRVPGLPQKVLGRASCGYAVKCLLLLFMWQKMKAVRQFRRGGEARHFARSQGSPSRPPSEEQIDVRVRRASSIHKDLYKLFMLDDKPIQPSTWPRALDTRILASTPCPSSVAYWPIILFIWLTRAVLGLASFASLLTRPLGPH